MNIEKYLIRQTGKTICVLFRFHNEILKELRFNKKERRKLLHELGKVFYIDEDENETQN